MGHGRRNTTEEAVRRVLEDTPGQEAEEREGEAEQSGDAALLKRIGEQVREAQRRGEQVRQGPELRTWHATAEPHPEHAAAEDAAEDRVEAFVEAENREHAAIGVARHGQDEQIRRNPQGTWPWDTWRVTMQEPDGPDGKKSEELDLTVRLDQ